MATIKSYTDLEQSKKLAEIPPLESADNFHIIGHYHTDGPRYEVIRSRNEVNEPENYWPCWSLAALLDVIPYNITFNKAVYRFKLVKFSDHWECYHENFGTVSTNIFKADNSVDVCVAMILKLHELNLLMKLLKELVEDNNQRYFYPLLRSLYEQLKKLKGE